VRNHTQCKFKGIVSRDFVVCFLVSLDRLLVSTHKERVHLLLKFRFSVGFFFIFASGRSESKMARKCMLVLGNCPSPELYTNIQSSSVQDPQ
jgi:hypothetical protein